MRAWDKLSMPVIVLVILISACGFISLVYAQAGGVTVKPTDDTYVDSVYNNTNYGGKIVLDIIKWQIYNNTYEMFLWLKFNLSSVPDGAIVDMATLQLHASVVGETYYVHAYSCPDNSWTELTLTYSNMPSYNTTSMDSTMVSTNDQWYNWSVVDAVRNALNSSSKLATIVLREPTVHISAFGISFDSKESPVSPTDYSPRIAVHWSGIVPEFSSLLVPALFMIATLLAVVFYRKRAVS
jgi:hypothetical protein